MKKLFAYITFVILISYINTTCTSTDKRTAHRITDEIEYNDDYFIFREWDSFRFGPDNTNFDSLTAYTKTHENATVFFDYNYCGPLILWSTDGINSYFNSPTFDRYFQLTLLSKTLTMYHVIVWSALGCRPLASGYISRTTPLRIFSKVEHLTVYDSPDNHSHFIKDTVSYYSDPITVVDFYGRWLKIRRSRSDTTMYIEGWIKAFEQCPDVFTTCS